MLTVLCIAIMFHSCCVHSLCSKVITSSSFTTENYSYDFLFRTLFYLCWRWWWYGLLVLALTRFSEWIHNVGSLFTRYPHARKDVSQAIQLDGSRSKKVSIFSYISIQIIVSSVHMAVVVVGYKSAKSQFNQ